MLIKEIQDTSILQLIVFFFFKYYVIKANSFNVENNLSCFSCSMDTIREKSQLVISSGRSVI